MKPTEQQQLVIDSTERDILVEAGAGSGKTTTTVNRYIRLISEAGYEPHQILAFTFTDKAAGDLRKKVRKARRRLAEERLAGQAAKELGPTVSQDESNPQALSMSSAWIGTFHAICSRILKSYPVEAGIDPGFTVIDDVTSATLRRQAFDDALTIFLEQDQDGESREVMVGLISEWTLRRTVEEIFDELRSRGFKRPRLPDFPDTPYPTEKITYLRRDIERVMGLKGHHHTHKPKLERLELLLADSAWQPECDDLAPLRFGSGKEDRAEFCQTLNEAVNDLAAHEGGDHIRREVGLLLELFGDRFEKLKSSRSLLDYEDLQLMTLRLLRDPKHHRIRAAYRNRFREIMVDEFQDTNQLQLDLVAELRGEETTLMTVGDEMQSIYGFRHADVELFRKRRNSLGKESRFTLSDNFRSQPEVIAAVNEIGVTLDRQVSQKRDNSEGPSRHEFAELTMGRNDPDPSSATAILTGHDGWKPLDLGPLAPPIPPEAEIGPDETHFNEAEALKLARHLRRMVDSGQVEPGDIAILLRAKTRSDIYVNALKQVGLTPYLTGGSGFWGSREAIDLRSLLSVLANPLEDEALLGVLASPACGVSSDTLWLLRRAAPGYSPLWPTVRAAAGETLPEGGTKKWLDLIPSEDQRLIVNLVETIDRLRSVAATIPLESLVERAVSGTGYDLANLIWDDSRIGMANVRRIASLARDYESAEGRDLRGFLDWVSLSARLNRESPAATEEEDSDVVRIMTIHAAKGLEFKVACVPDCGRGFRDNYKLPVRLGKPADGADPHDFEVGLKLSRPDGSKFELFGWTGLQQRAAANLEDEELRLFHVALTRAEDHLILGGVLPDKQPTKVSEALSVAGRISLGFDLDPTDPEGWPEALPEGPEPDARIELVRNFPSEEAASMLRKEEQPFHDPPGLRLGTPPLHRPDQRIFPNIPLSFTALNEYEECPARFFAGRVLGLEDPVERGLANANDPDQENVTSRDHGTRFGSAVHDVLESLGRSQWPRLKDETLQKALAGRGLDPGSGLDLARQMIEGFRNSDLGERIRAGRATFEAPLLVRVRDITIRGFADVLLDGPVPLVLDYKTNRLDGQSPDQKMAGYVQQRNLYALAVARFHGLDEVETAFVFLARPEDPVLRTLDRADLERAEEELGTTIDDIVAGQFFTRTESGREPCGDCWACSMLAPRIARANA